MVAVLPARPAVEVLVDVGVVIRQGVARPGPEQPALGLRLGVELRAAGPDVSQDVGVGDEGELAGRVVHVVRLQMGSIAPLIVYYPNSSSLTRASLSKQVECH